MPGIRRVGLLLNSRHCGFEAELAATRRAADALKLDVATVDARAPDELPRAFDALKHANLQGVVGFPDALMTRMAPALAEFSLREQLPVVAGWAAIARGGVLASYGPDLGEAYERVGMQAARILRGADPSTMPIEQPTRIFIVVNLKAAQALGLKLPPALIARANEVIR